MKQIALGAVAMLLVFMSGCTPKLHKSVKPETAVSMLHTEASASLYGYFDSDIPSEYPRSGFYPLPNNLDAFAARVAIIQNAKKTLDVQYYLFRPDNTGLTMTKLLLDAADRGVHVRLILDDMLQGKNDQALLALQSHPNIDIKLFNPTYFRKSLRYLEMLFHIDTLGRRMHNKALIADNSAAIIGGRNIEDIYFAADEKNIFIDNDILAVGPLVAEISNAFETYWVSPVSVPLQAVAGEKTVSRKAVQDELNNYVHSFAYSDYMKAVRATPTMQRFHDNRVPLVFGQAQLYFDFPTKVIASENETDTHLSEHIVPLFKNAQRSIMIVSPYFMPNPTFMEGVRQLRERGVEITVLTNSLATNDAIPVYAAYAKYQKALLRLGVHLYELSPVAFHRLFKNANYKRGSLPRSALHAKTTIIDGEIYIIGSANMDPRSTKLNTELVAVIRSKALSLIGREGLRHATAPENAYALSLEKAPEKPLIATWIPQEKERVVWTTVTDGKEVKYYDDGNAGFWRRLGSNLVSYFPIEGYL